MLEYLSRRSAVAIVMFYQIATAEDFCAVNPERCETKIPDNGTDNSDEFLASGEFFE
jgi:hypothetical protein